MGRAVCGSIHEDHEESGRIPGTETNREGRRVDGPMSSSDGSPTVRRRPEHADNLPGHRGDSCAGGPEPDPNWLAEFEAAARRPLAMRWRYAFIRTYKPVLDDARYRSFDTMEEYRHWCESNLPEWLGYGRV